MSDFSPAQKKSCTSGSTPNLTFLRRLASKNDIPRSSDSHMALQHFKIPLTKPSGSRLDFNDPDVRFQIRNSCALTQNYSVNPTAKKPSTSRSQFPQNHKNHKSVKNLPQAGPKPEIPIQNPKKMTNSKSPAYFRATHQPFSKNPFKGSWKGELLKLNLNPFGTQRQKRDINKTEAMRYGK